MSRDYLNCRLPVIMLGVPTAEGVSVRIVAEEVEDKTGFYIEPAPAYQRTQRQ